MPATASIAPTDTDPVERLSRFEAVLTAGFALEMSKAAGLTDPRITYLLDELGKESRHSRLFIMVLGEIQPQAVNPSSGACWAAPSLNSSPLAEWRIRCPCR